MVVPVSKVSFGFFSGGGEYAPTGKVAGAALAEQKTFPFLGTAVAGVSLTPKAFLVTTEEGVTVVPANYDSTLDRLVGQLPKFVKEVRLSLQQKEQEKEGESRRRGGSPPRPGPWWRPPAAGCSWAKTSATGGPWPAPPRS